MSEFDSPSYAEYVYDKKAEGKSKLLKYLLALCYLIFVLAFFCVCYVTRLIPLFAVCPIVTWILIYFTWPLVSYDIFYTFEHGHMQIGKIKRRKSGNRRVTTVALDVQRAILITSYHSSLNTEEFKSAKRVHNFASTLSSQNLITIVYEANGAREAIIIENTPKLARLLPKYSVANNVEYR